MQAMSEEACVRNRVSKSKSCLSEVCSRHTAWNAVSNSKACLHKHVLEIVLQKAKHVRTSMCSGSCLKQQSMSEQAGVRKFASKGKTHLFENSAHVWTHLCSTFRFEKQSLVGNTSVRMYASKGKGWLFNQVLEVLFQKVAPVWTTMC